MIEVTDEQVREDIQAFKLRILIAETKLEALFPAMTRADREKDKQLRNEIKHVKGLIKIAETAL